MAQKRFIYSAGATAVGAVLTKPAVSRAWASVSLPSIGGVVTSMASGQQVPTALAGILSFNTAVTEITGRMQNKQAVTDVITTVTGLDVCGGKLKAERIELRMTFAFNESNEKLASVTVTAGPYTGLEIDGKPVAVTLNSQLADDAGKNHKKFRDNLPAKSHPRDHSSKDDAKPGRERQFGRVHANLVNETLQQDPEKGEFSYIAASFGRVHFVDWAQDDNWQSIVGLRIELDGKTGAEGTIVIADIDPNGEFYP
jgi:hypothetical protein